MAGVGQGAVMRVRLVSAEGPGVPLLAVAPTERRSARGGVGRQRPEGTGARAAPLAVGLGLRRLAVRGVSQRQAAESVHSQAVEDAGRALSRLPPPSRVPRAGACGGSARVRRQGRGAPSMVRSPLGK